MSEENGAHYWHGTVLIVTKPGQHMPQLELKAVGPTNNTSANGATGLKSQQIDGLKLYADPVKEFWRFSIQLPLVEAEYRWQYSLSNVKFLSDVHPEPVREFYVPASTESMRIMFHSCNGFSVGTDEDFWSGMYTGLSFSPRLT